MSSELDKEPDTTSEITHSLVNMITELDGVPLPPVVKKNFFKAVNRLITEIVEVPATWLESKSQAIRDKTNARSLITTESAKAAAKKFGSDEKLIERAVDYYGTRILREQYNREAITKAALKELSSSSPDDATNQEIDEDWLDMFSSIAEKRSNQEMQLYLAKLLAGEIKKPGSFHPLTVEVLARLTPDIARNFQNICNISTVISGFDPKNNSVICLVDNSPFIITEPYGQPGENALSELGFSYVVLTQLQDAGLIQYDFQAWRELYVANFLLPIEVGGTVLQFTASEASSQEFLQEKRRVKVINFTTAGIQLRRIVDKTPNEKFLEKLKNWVSSTYKLQSI